ncbi:unnamed protein product [Cylicocyclus nassatus]|uniref:Uncharacterized protein n=1 Tax=Cylicocyclus nassatus TaxID=53992 RepID=A0AA36MD52_CYLNA|nr:unnamed protein product [Cylicocyclus nassatus]
MLIRTVPPNVKSLFPKENLDFAESITEDEGKLLREVFNKHDSFEEIGEMIEAVWQQNPELAGRMRKVLDGNIARLKGLSPEAVDYSKRIVAFVTHVMSSLSLGKDYCLETAERLHKEFQTLSQEDQEALRRANPDVHF